jgi:hypothetical protein
MDPDGQPKISDGPRLRLWQWASLRWQVKLEGGEGWQVVLSVAVRVTSPKPVGWTISTGTERS